ncbi:energy-coupling factor transporter transmembrane protein EcfT [bacterium]|nr:energy-coupling factor transporter transmembrane protein EcfT [bacterium]
MNRLPTGMYLPGSSVIHKLDGRVKLLSLILVIAAVLLVDSLLGYSIMLVFTAVLILLSGISLNTALNSVNRLYWFFILILLMNTVFYNPENAWVSFWIFNPSLAGLMQGIDVVLRVFLVLVISNVLTSTTAPMEITNALERLMSPLSFIGIPTEQIAMILSVAIQFIPTLSEETDMIRKAQMARGARFDSKKLTEKAEAVMPLVIPIFFAAFKRADELSLAMEARGYRTAAGRTRKKYTPLQAPDVVALVIVLGLCILQIVIR